MQTVFTYMQRHGRVPMLSKRCRPWKFKGWLLPYIMPTPRWRYFVRTLDAGRLLDEPIPQVHFGEPDRRVFSDLHKWAEIIGWDLGGWSDFRTLLDWFEWALGIAKSPPRLDDMKAEKLYRTVNIGPMLEKPHDYLGQHVAEWRAKGWNPSAFFPTPHPVVECMVQMTLHDAKADGKDPRLLSVCDPCVGSGRMLLHASNFSLRLFGQDIDALCCSMCKINGALYAPWLTFPLPASVVGPVPG